MKGKTSAIRPCKESNKEKGLKFSFDVVMVGGCDVAGRGMACGDALLCGVRLRMP